MDGGTVASLAAHLGQPSARGTICSVGSWVVYVLVSEDRGRTYVGTTTDLERRLAQHNGELPGGAKATRAGRPWSVGASSTSFESRGDAQRFEALIKRSRGASRLSACAPAGRRRRPSRVG
jgi:predicted GIY-YIG superfamily endonuclease